MTKAQSQDSQQLNLKAHQELINSIKEKCKNAISKLYLVNNPRLWYEDEDDNYQIKRTDKQIIDELVKECEAFNYPQTKSLVSLWLNNTGKAMLENNKKETAEETKQKCIKYIEKITFEELDNQITQDDKMHYTFNGDRNGWLDKLDKKVLCEPQNKDDIQFINDLRRKHILRSCLRDKIKGAIDTKAQKEIDNLNNKQVDNLDNKQVCMDSYINTIKILAQNNITGSQDKIKMIAKKFCEKKEEIVVNTFLYKSKFEIENMFEELGLKQQAKDALKNFKILERQNIKKLKAKDLQVNSAEKFWHFVTCLPRAFATFIAKQFGSEWYISTQEIKNNINSFKDLVETHYTNYTNNIMKK